jgi:hypothetical protein
LLYAGTAILDKITNKAIATSNSTRLKPSVSLIFTKAPLENLIQPLNRNSCGPHKMFLSEIKDHLMFFIVFST